MFPWHFWHFYLPIIISSIPYRVQVPSPIPSTQPGLCRRLRRPCCATLRAKVLPTHLSLTVLLQYILADLVSCTVVLILFNHLSCISRLLLSILPKHWKSCESKCEIIREPCTMSAFQIHLHCLFNPASVGWKCPRGKACWELSNTKALAPRRTPGNLRRKGLFWLLKRPNEAAYAKQFHSSFINISSNKPICNKPI